jgi:transposase
LNVDVPASSATVARAAFPSGNSYLHLRGRLGTIFTDARFAPLFANRGQPAECAWRLALVTLLQFAGNLSGRRATDSVRGRIRLEGSARPRADRSWLRRLSS